jgi:hypothetical protein
LETSEPQPVSLLTETQKHRASKTQSWSFRPSEVEGIEEGSLRVRVVLQSYVEEWDERVRSESDEFLMVTDITQLFSAAPALGDAESGPGNGGAA